MRIWDVLRLRFRSITRRDRADNELNREFQFHLDRQIEEFVASGMPPEEARYEARRVLGGPTQLQEECRDMRNVAWFEHSTQDLKYAARALAKTPGFTFVAVLSLALGIGANTAIFSVVQAVLVRDLPYPDSARLVHLAHPNGGNDSGSILEYLFLKEHSTSFASVAAQRDLGDQTLIAGSDVVGIKVAQVSADFFRTLGVPPAAGREFNSDETRQGGPISIILTDALWRNAFASDPSIVGRRVTVNGGGVAVAGVLPPNFWFATDADAFIPLAPSGVAAGDEGLSISLLARLNPGVGTQQADAELATLGASFKRANPSVVGDDYLGLSTTPYREWLTGDVRTNLLLLFGAVLLLLIIACTNLASLLFARLTARQREIAVRLALGSSPARLMRLFVIENFLIVLMGCAAGIAAAAWSIDALVHLFPYALPASAPIGLNWQVLAFSFSISIVTALAFSIAPVAMSSRVKLDQALKAGRSQSSGVRQRVRALLVITEVALSTALLVAAALLIATLYREHQERLGFDPNGVITFQTPPLVHPAKNDDLHAFEASVFDRIRAIPGVRNVACANVLPLTQPNNYPTQRQGHPDQAFGGMEIRVVSPSYFETMGIPILRGRGMDATDVGNSMPVIMVNETVAKQWWPDGNFVGSRIEIGRYRGKVYGDGDPARTVIGVVGDTKSVRLKQAPRPTVYIPAAQTLIGGNDVAWIVRGNLTPGLMQQIRQAVATVDLRRRITDVRTMDEIVAFTMRDSRFDAWLFGMFAGAGADVDHDRRVWAGRVFCRAAHQ